MVNKQSRRTYLTRAAAVGSGGLLASLAGCSDVLDTASDSGDGDGEDENLQEKWEENDDYPDDEFRNHRIMRSGFIPFIGGEDGTETTFGSRNIALRLGVSENYHRSSSLEVSFEAGDPVDVYVIPGEVELELQETIDLSNHEHVSDFSEFGVNSYHNIFETTNEEKVYTMVITLAGFRPPQTIAERQEFVEEREETTLEGWQESAVYIPFEEYKEHQEARILYNNDNSGDRNLNND